MAGTIIHEDAHKTGDFRNETTPEDSIFHNADVVDACSEGDDRDGDNEDPNVGGACVVSSANGNESGQLCFIDSD